MWEWRPFWLAQPRAPRKGKCDKTGKIWFCWQIQYALPSVNAIKRQSVQKSSGFGASSELFERLSAVMLKKNSTLLLWTWIRQKAVFKRACSLVTEWGGGLSPIKILDNLSATSVRQTSHSNIEHLNMSSTFLKCVEGKLNQLNPFYGSAWFNWIRRSHLHYIWNANAWKCLDSQIF